MFINLALILVYISLICDIYKICKWYVGSESNESANRNSRKKTYYLQPRLVRESTSNTRHSRILKHSGFHRAAQRSKK